MAGLGGAGGWAGAGAAAGGAGGGGAGVGLGSGFGNLRWGHGSRVLGSTGMAADATTAGLAAVRLALGGALTTDLAPTPSAAKTTIPATQESILMTGRRV